MEPKPLKTFRTEFSIYEPPSSVATVPTPERYVTLIIFFNLGFFINLYIQGGVF